MTQQPPSEMLNSQHLATIERQRRIICDLLLKNEALRRRLTHTGKNTGVSKEQESARRRLEADRQTSRFVEMRIHGGNDHRGFAPS